MTPATAAQHFQCCQTWQHRGSSLEALLRCPAARHWSRKGVVHRGQDNRVNSTRLALSPQATQLTCRALPKEEGKVEISVEELVEIGKISSAHGVRGELKVIPSTDFPEQRFMTPGVRYLKVPSAGRRKGNDLITPVQLTKGRMMLSKGRELWLVTLKEVTSKEQADELSKYTLLVSKDERPELEEDEVYVQDLIDMKVILEETGEAIGSVADVYEGTGVYDTVRVALLPREDGQDAGTFLIPFMDDMIPRVDTEEGVMVIRPAEGLIEATMTKEKAVKKNRPRRRRPVGKGKEEGSSQEAE